MALLTDSVIQNTQPHEETGFAIGVAEGAYLQATGMTVTHNTGLGVTLEGGRASLVDSLIENTEETLAGGGFGIQVTDGSHLEAMSVH